jgi:hypothetical protein
VCDIRQQKESETRERRAHSRWLLVPLLVLVLVPLLLLLASPHKDQAAET